LLILNTTLPTGVVEPIGADFEFSSKLEWNLIYDTSVIPAVGISRVNFIHDNSF
jgi:hypothetical protein